jgi:hypothetical protein
MPVTIRPSSCVGREVKHKYFVASPEELLKESCSKEHRHCKEVIQSSFNNLGNEDTKVYASSNGFVRAAWDAYCNHHHLTIRPEDVWFSILSQLSFFVNAYAEELRSFFVEHEDRKELEGIELGTMRTVEIGKMAVRMTSEMEKHIIDPDLREWVMPEFHDDSRYG